MLDCPDSITVAPWGDVLVTEDSISSPQSRLLGITPEGEMYVIGQTLTGELSGLCFSPDGRTMFISIFNRGVTLVVSGPFPEPLERVPDPTEPDLDWGSAGAGGAPEVPIARKPPAPTAPRAPASRIRPARGCGLGAPEAPTEDAALALAVALGTAALAAGRGDGGK
jgi:secreted PhoX family phosphatase